MRHHLVVNLQPIGMVYEVMDRRLRAPEPDLAEVHASARKINGFARDALNSCLDVVSWLAPQEEMLTTAGEGVRDCLGLLATSLAFRGYALRNEVQAVAGQVRRSAIRNVLSGALIHAADENQPPADIVLTAEPTQAGLLLTVTVRPTQGEQGFSEETGYRPLEWCDLQALAEAESVELKWEGRQGTLLAIPWATA